MAPVSIRVDPAVLADAYAQSRSGRNLAKRLGIRHAETAKRVARDAGYEIPAPHWGAHTVPDEPETPRERLKRDLQVDELRGKLKNLQQAYDESRSEIRTQSHYLSQVVEACGEPCVRPVLEPPLVQDEHKPARSVVVHISDWQMGQQVSAVDTGGNVYDWDIMLGRVERFYQGVVGSLRNVSRSYRIEDITYLYGGDMVEGHDIFKGQAYQLCKDAGAQTVDGSVIWAEFEAQMEADYPGVPKRRIAIPGNHSIPGGRGAGAVPASIAYEYMWYELLRHHTSALDTPSEYAHHGRILFDVAGQPCLTTHGDEIRGQLGIPFYGIRTGWMKHSQELGEVFRYWMFAHIHQTSMVTYGDGAALSNGDAVGYNNLTGKLRNPSSTPQQSVYFMSRERGLDEISYIHLVEKS